MATIWAKWVGLAAFLALCVILVTAAPPSIYDEELEPAEDQQQTSVDGLYEAEDSALTRTRRDSIGSYSHHKGWGWYPPVGPVVPVLVRLRRGDEYGHSSGGGGGGGGGHGHHGWAYLGPVYTYAKTDHYANFKWGVRHHVGGHGWHGRR